MTKIIFHILNIIFIILYVYPGSLLGYLVHKDISKQPRISPDFFELSSNHVYAFLILSLLGLISYFKHQKLVIIYLILISVILEILHLYIPQRSFQFSDLFGNIVGVLLSIFVLILFNLWREK